MNGLNLQDRKLWIGLGVVAALLVVAAAWMFAIGPKRSDTESLRSQAADAVVQNSQLSAQVVALQRHERHLPAYRLELAKAIEALPPTPALSEFTRSLARVATIANVKLSSIAVSGIAAATQAAVAVPTASPTASSSSSSSSSTVAPAVVATSAAPSQLSATITLQVSGSLRNELLFLEAVREGTRSALVTSAQFSTGDNAALTTQIEVFSAPQTAQQLAQLHTLLTSGK